MIPFPPPLSSVLRKVLQEPSPLPYCLGVSTYYEGAMTVHVVGGTMSN